MQERREVYKSDARSTLARLHIAVGQDYHTLSSDHVEALLAEADKQHYRKQCRSIQRLQTKTRVTFGV